MSHVQAGWLLVEVGVLAVVGIVILLRLLLTGRP